MLDCISVENMRLSDAMTIEKYVPSLELMRRAAEGVFRAAKWHGKVAIVVGSGNNGGDGFALACILHRKNIECAVFTVSQRLSADSAYYATQVANLGVPISPFTPGCLNGFDMVVDCLLGTGFQGGLRENYRIAIEAINASGAEVISVDINSGMHGDTGEGELIVRSDLTITIGFVKHGLVTQNAGRYIKRLVCADIGICLAKEESKICTDAEHHPNAIPCPQWLDVTVIKAFSETPTFRKLLRHRQQLSDAECIEILKTEPRGVLSVIGDEGYPYGLPIDHWYCAENGKLYFHCGKVGHKLDAIRNCDKVSYCVMDSGTPEEGGWALYFRSVIVFGRAQIIEDKSRVIEITRQLSYKFTNDTAYIEDEIAKYAIGTLCIELTPEHICGKRVHEA